MSYQRLETTADRALFVVADIHGDLDALDAALSAAEAGALVVFLGDVVDRGPYSPLCAERVLDVIEDDAGVLIAGNHDIALLEVAEGRRAPTPRRVETLEQFEAYGGDVLERFCAAVRAAPLCLRIGSFAFAHAAWRPDMETDAPWSAALRRVALLGEHRAAPGRRRPETSYRWVDRIDAGQTVMVGHDRRGDAEPLRLRSRRGGEAVFLDLGCGEGGRLGCAQIRAAGVDYFAF